MPKGFLLSFGFTNESDNHCSAAQVYGEHNRSSRSQILLKCTNKNKKATSIKKKVHRYVFQSNLPKVVAKCSWAARVLAHRLFL